MEQFLNNFVIAFLSWFRIRMPLTSVKMFAKQGICVFLNSGYRKINMAAILNNLPNPVILLGSYVSLGQCDWSDASCLLHLWSWGRITDGGMMWSVIIHMSGGQKVVSHNKGTWATCPGGLFHIVAILRLPSAQWYAKYLFVAYLLMSHWLELVLWPSQI